MFYLGNEELYRREIRRLKDELVKSTNLINDLQIKAIENGPATLLPNNYREAKLTPNFEVYLEKNFNRQKSMKKLNFSDQITKFSIEMETNFTIFTEKIKENLNIIKEKICKKEARMDYFSSIITRFAKNEINYNFIIDLHKNKLGRLVNKQQSETNNNKDETASLYEIINNYNSNWALLKFLEKKKTRNKKESIMNENISLFEKLLDLIEELRIENAKWNKDPESQEGIANKLKNDYMQKIISLNEENMR